MTAHYHMTWKAKVAHVPAPHQAGPRLLACRDSQGDGSVSAAMATPGTTADCFPGADLIHLTLLSSGLLGMPFGVFPSELPSLCSGPCPSPLPLFLGESQGLGKR